MIVAIIGAGQMGAAIGARCVSRGAEVITPLAGRSQASQDRAREAGMRPCELAEIRNATLVLSILPSSQADAAADAALSHLESEGPLYIDANALAPARKIAMARRMEAVGARFSDAVIIGHPPQGDLEGPRLYVSGEPTEPAIRLRELGLDLRFLDGPVGTAAALKLCYAALNKGLTALTTASLLAAESSGVATALSQEWAISQTFIASRMRSAVPAMYPKAARWVSEFEEISRFAGEHSPAGELFGAMARFFAERATENVDDSELQRLLEFLQWKQG